MFMVIKTITITGEAYENIKRLKAADESFSKLFMRLSREKVKVRDLLGAVKMKDAEAMKRKIAEYRKKVSKDILERRKDVHHG